MAVWPYMPPNRQRAMWPPREPHQQAPSSLRLSPRPPLSPPSAPRFSNRLLRPFAPAIERSSSSSNSNSSRLEGSGSTTPITSPEEVLIDPAPSSFGKRKHDPTSYLDVDVGSASAGLAHAQQRALDNLPHFLRNSPWMVDGDPFGAIPADVIPAVKLFIAHVNHARRRYRDRPDVCDLFSVAQFDSDDEHEANESTRFIQTVAAAQAVVRGTPTPSEHDGHDEDEGDDSSSSTSESDGIPTHDAADSAPARTDNSNPATQSHQHMIAMQRRQRNHRIMRRLRQFNRPYTVVIDDEDKANNPAEGQQCDMLLHYLGTCTFQAFAYIEPLFPELQLCWGPRKGGPESRYCSNDKSSVFAPVLAGGSLA